MTASVPPHGNSGQRSRGAATRFPDMVVPDTEPAQSDMRTRPEPRDQAELPLSLEFPLMVT
eukprot:2885954-Rhodomonas_salina.4